MLKAPLAATAVLAASIALPAFAQDYPKYQISIHNGSEGRSCSAVAYPSDAEGQADRHSRSYVAVTYRVGEGDAEFAAAPGFDVASNGDFRVKVVGGGPASSFHLWMHDGAGFSVSEGQERMLVSSLEKARELVLTATPSNRRQSVKHIYDMSEFGRKMEAARSRCGRGD